MTRRPSTTRQRVKALETADDAGVQVVGFNIPELVVTPAQDYEEIEGYRFEIPAGALIVALTAYARITAVPDDGSATVRAAVFTEEEEIGGWNGGDPDFSSPYNNTDLVAAAINTPPFAQVNADNGFYHSDGLVFHFAFAVNGATTGSATFEDVSVRIAYVSP